jgi:hypothetical protein
MSQKLSQKSKKFTKKFASISYRLKEEGLYFDGNVLIEDLNDNDHWFICTDDAQSEFKWLWQNRPWLLSKPEAEAILDARGEKDWGGRYEWEDIYNSLLAGKSYVSRYVAGKLFSYEGTRHEGLCQVPAWIKEGVARSRIARGIREFPREEIEKMDVTALQLSRFLRLTKDWEVRRFLKLYQQLYVVGRAWGSPYQPNQIKTKVIALTPNYNRLPLWVKEVLIKSSQWIQTERIGDIWKLIPAARAWKICPDLPKAIAVRVGKMPLWKRLAAAGAWRSLHTDWVSFCRRRRMRAEEDTKNEARCQILTQGLSIFSGLEEERGYFSRREVIIEFWRRFNTLCQEGIDAALIASGDLPRAIAIKYPEISGDVARLLISLLQRESDLDENKIAIVCQMDIKTFAQLMQPKIDRYKDWGGGDRFSFKAANNWAYYSWEYKSLLSLVIVFGSRYQQWLEMREDLSNYLVNGSHWLPLAPPQALEGLGDWLFAHSNLKAEELEIVASQWYFLSQEKRSLPDLWRVLKEEEEERFRRAQKKIALQSSKFSTCNSCRYYSGQSILPCAVNLAFNLDPDIEICIDWEPK